MTRAKTIHLGFEIGSGARVEIPVTHMVVTGQTQMSGKTTTLEALLARSGLTAITFITKRGEESFGSAHRMQPYFRDRADWQFVEALFAATLNEKNRFLRPFIMKVCRATKKLADVQAEVRRLWKKSHGIAEGVYTQLDAYLDMIVPEIERADLAETLELRPGLNVMDLREFQTPMQMLFVQSAIDWINDKCRDTIVVVPEAWEFIPEGKGSPVKESAVTLVRKGAVLRNFIWVDSQDMAGVDKVVTRACTTWIIGVQRETNEIKRNIANIPAGTQRPKPNDIALLERGVFFACHGKVIQKTYVQPAWMVDIDAEWIAQGKMSIDDVLPPPRPEPLPAPPPAREEEVTRDEANALKAHNEELTAKVAALELANGQLVQLMSAAMENGIRVAVMAVRASLDNLLGEASSQANNGTDGTVPVTFAGGHAGAVMVHRDGKPLTGADIAPGAEITANRRTGQVTDIKPQRSAGTPDRGRPAGEKMLAGLKLFTHGAKEWQHVCVIAGVVWGNGYSYGGRKFLIEGGMAVEADGVIKTSVGNQGAQLPSRADVIERWTAMLTEPAPTMLKALRDGKEQTTKSLAEATGVKPGNGHWYGGLKPLRNAGLIEQNGDKIQLSEFMRSLQWR